MKNQNIRVSVVIPTYNRAEDLKRCLDSLMRQTFKDFEIIIVDNGCIDETPQLLEKYPVRVIKDFAKNGPHLFNSGWQNSQAEIVVFTNDDAEAEPLWLESLLNTLNQCNDAVVVGGPTLLLPEALDNQEMIRLYLKAKTNLLFKIPAWIYERFILDGKYYDIGALCESGAYSVGGSLSECVTKLDAPISVDLLSMTNVAIKRHILEELNGLDENFRFTHGDGDLFVRIRKSGYKLIFNPKAVVWHHVNPIGNTRVAFWRGRDQAYFLRKCISPKALSGWFKLALNVIFFNLFWVYKTIETRDLAFLKGISGFLKGISDYKKLKKRSYFQSNQRYNLFNYRIGELVESDKTVLDVGCATGKLLEYLQKNKNCNVFGIEIDKEMANDASKRCVQVICKDIESGEELPFSKISFDIIILADVLEHLKRPDEALRKIKPYLKDDGYLLISIPNIAFLTMRLGLLFGRFDYKQYGLLDKTHLRFFTLKTARKLIETSGYKIIHLEGYNQVRGRYFFIRPLAKISKTIFAADFIIKAVKD